MWGFEDLSNEDPRIPTYLWVFKTRAAARAFKKEHVKMPYASRLSGMRQFDDHLLRKFYEPVPKCIRSEYWIDKKVLREWRGRGYPW